MCTIDEEDTYVVVVQEWRNVLSGCFIGFSAKQPWFHPSISKGFEPFKGRPTRRLFKFWGAGSVNLAFVEQCSMPLSTAQGHSASLSVAQCRSALLSVVYYSLYGINFANDLPIDLHLNLTWLKNANWKLQLVKIVIEQLSFFRKYLIHVAKVLENTWWPIMKLVDHRLRSFFSSSWSAWSALPGHHWRNIWPERSSVMSKLVMS